MVLAAQVPSSAEPTQDSTVRIHYFFAIFYGRRDSSKSYDLIPVVMDTDGTQCVTVVPSLGTTDTSTSRSWTIQATQYLCSEDDLAG